MSYTILVVDDIVYNRLLITEIIESFGMQHAVAINGKEAIQWLEKKKFDCVLMDIEMPVMNGLETTKYIREELQNENKEVPVIAITAHGHSYTQEQLLSYGFTDLLKKPYTMESLAAKLSHVLHIEIKTED